VYELVREPMKKYLGSSLDLALGHPESVPFLRNVGNVDLSIFTPDVIDEMLEASFEKYFYGSGLFGAAESCIDVVNRVRDVDVDEIACLIDFGLRSDVVLEKLQKLNDVRILSNRA
jgi:hypothetical protein